jgi:hypothetical protein
LTRTRKVVSLTLAAVLAGCAAPSASPEASDGAISGSDEPAAATCEPLDLRLPSGEPLDLTGTWLGNDTGLYQVRQSGECVWWVGQTTSFLHVLQGTVARGLTVSATWATVASSAVGTPADAGYRPAIMRIGDGSILLRIEVGADGTNDTLSLVKVSGTDNSRGGITTTHWTRVDDEPDHPLPGADIR